LCHPDYATDGRVLIVEGRPLSTSACASMSQPTRPSTTQDSTRAKRGSLPKGSTPTDTWSPMQWSGGVDVHKRAVCRRSLPSRFWDLHAHHGKVTYLWTLELAPGLCASTPTWRTRRLHV